MFTFNDLVRYQHKGFLNGNWRKLNLLERAFFRASICYAKFKGKIVNSRIVAELRSIIEKLTLTFGKKVFMAGLEKVEELILKFEDREVFGWAPEVRSWLRYIFWLGLIQQEGESVYI